MPPVQVILKTVVVASAGVDVLPLGFPDPTMSPLGENTEQEFAPVLDHESRAASPTSTSEGFATMDTVEVGLGGIGFGVGMGIIGGGVEGGVTAGRPVGFGSGELPMPSAFIKAPRKLPRALLSRLPILD